jgi:hypothetical protein
MPNGMNTGRNLSLNKFKNIYNQTNTTDRIIYIISAVAIIGIVIYWVYYGYSKYEEMKKYTTLVTNYVNFVTNTRVRPVSVYGSKAGNQLSTSFWLKINNVPSQMQASQQLYTIRNMSTQPFISVELGDNQRFNNLNLLISTSVGTNPEICSIPNIPPYTWVHFSYVINNRNIDVYMNGKLIKSCLLNGIPLFPEHTVYQVAVGKQERGIIDCDLAIFQYYGRILSPNDIYNLSQQAPILTTASQ